MTACHEGCSEELSLTKFAKPRTAKNHKTRTMASAVGMNGHHRTRTFAHHPLGHTPQNQVFDSGAAVRGHHHRIDAEALDMTENFVSRFADRGMDLILELARQMLARELVKPLLGFGLHRQ